MPEPQQTTQDEAGVTRQPTGEIVSPPPTSTPPTTTAPQPSSQTTPQETPRETTKSLLNQEEPEKSVDGKGTPLTGAPDKYAEFKAPEGFVIDQTVLDEVSPLFKKLNLSQEGGQELMDLYIKHAKEAFETPFKTYQDTRQKWQSEIRADPSIGGKLGEVKASISRLIDSFGSTQVADGFREAMDITGAGDNPAVIRGLYALAQRLTEGRPVIPGGPSPEGQRKPGTPGTPSAAQAIYPHLPSQTG